ncbi:MAG: hypothetical protein H6622_15775 [Halobacteriovoraceae bacterium]|nr:hypothetical protein [Halobacteriovoraceae bacterium]
MNFYFGSNSTLFSKVDKQQIYLLKLFHLNKIKRVPLIKLSKKQLKDCENFGKLSDSAYQTLLSIEKTLVDRVSSIVDVELGKKMEDLRVIIGNDEKVLSKKRDMIYKELLSKHISNYLLFIDSKNSHYVYK